MLRKVTLGLIAAASLSAVALLPTSASAHGHGMHGGHFGWGHGFGVYINTGVSDCYQTQVIQTPNGPRLRTINVCAYDVY